jgi:hypothetical protein
MAVEVACTVKVNMYSVLVGEAKGERRFRKHRFEGEDNIGMDLKEI